MEIKRIRLENFKGIKDKTVELFSKTKIKGQNGSGKTTIADALYWVFADKSYSLVSNPAIRPNDAEDAVEPTVTIYMTVDGKPVTICKVQKLKRSKPDSDGVTKVSLTNSYLVNDVPKSERDFKAYMEDLGVDMERFLLFSHPDMFVAGMSDKKGRDSIRNTLFEMAKSVSDLEIAEQMGNVPDVAELLKNYTVEEITAMQNATMRKIAENYGKNGEILLAQIEGLAKAKVDIDVAELELAKNELKRQISEIEKQIATVSDGGVSSLEQEHLKVMFDLNSIKQTMNQGLIDAKRILDADLYDAERELKEIELSLSSTRSSIQKETAERESLQGEIESIKPKYAELKNLAFDENGKVCPYCKQILPEDRIQAAIKEFEDKKSADIKRMADYGNGLAVKASELAKSIAENNAKIVELEKAYAEKKDAVADLKAKLDKVPSDADYASNPEYVALEQKSRELQAAIDSGKSSSVDVTPLIEKKKELDGELLRASEEIGKFHHNDTIDEQIAELKASQLSYEQSRADAEKILYQLSLVSQRKNELLEDSVNKNFDIVKFKLFDYLKNGTVFDTCVPLIDGFEFGKSTNTGREILAKLDIINGLQKFYGKNYPVVLDGAEALSEITESRIKVPFQIVMLTVTEDKTVIVESR